MLATSIGLHHGNQLYGTKAHDNVVFLAVARLFVKLYERALKLTAANFCHGQRVHDHCVIAAEVVLFSAHHDMMSCTLCCLVPGCVV